MEIAVGNSLGVGEGEGSNNLSTPSQSKLSGKVVAEVVLDTPVACKFHFKPIFSYS